MDIRLLESLLNQIATELVLAKEGSDDGLLPIYSLLGELQEHEWPYSEVLDESVEALKAVLDKLLEKAAPFDTPTLHNAHTFTKWLERYIHAIQYDEGMLDPFVAATSEKSLEKPPTPPATPLVDAVLQLNLASDREILEEFCTELVEHLEVLEGSLLTLEKAADAESLKTVYRAFHTIKGVAGFLHLTPIEVLTHKIEALLDKAVKGKITLRTSAITLILQSKDLLEQFWDQINLALKKGTLPEKIIPVSALVAAVEHEVESAGVVEQEQMSDTGALTPVKKQHTSYIRVDTNKLDNLMNMVGELVIAHSQLTERIRALNIQDTPFQQNLTQLFRVTKSLQYSSMSLRMTPIRSIFQKISRQVRDLAHQLNKKVRLEVSGEETELDRNVVEKLSDPLVHMIRNAVDHGIEAEEERVAGGKDRTGTLALKAYYKGSNILIEVSDDGKGMDPQMILKKAEQKGLVPPGQEYSDKDILQFIFLPGFSTAEVVSEISGRGIGMDVVKKNIEELRGTFEIDSEVGKGTRFKISLPLTTAIIDGLIVRVGNEKFIIPSTSVRIVISPQANQIKQVQGGREVLSLRNDVIPIKRLHQRFSIEPSEKELTRGAIVVIENLGNPYGLFVDEMLAKQEVVIKNIGHLREANPDLSGGAILGDGNAVLILDPNSLAD
ncbi:MAG TPA: chemotaxis protein CheA [Opitutae bacterium]|nr:chemotaxis protein CheA [Opitutae bacterium]